MTTHCPSCTCTPSANEFREIAEWDWVYTDADDYDLLHHVADGADWQTLDADWGGAATLTCGLDGYVHIPGMGSRMTTPRCLQCCDQTGMPHGTGSPKNDDACRPLAKARIAHIAAEASAAHTDGTPQ